MNTSIEVGQTKFFQVEMALSMKNQLLLVSNKDFDSTSKLTFSEVDSVHSHQQSVGSSDFENNNLGTEWNNFILLSVKNNKEKIVFSMTAEDKKQWLRLFNLIIKMRELVLDFDKISIFH